MYGHSIAKKKKEFPYGSDNIYHRKEQEEKKKVRRKKNREVHVYISQKAYWVSKRDVVHHNILSLIE
jgi:hypothetical protein